MLPHMPDKCLVSNCADRVQGTGEASSMAEALVRSSAQEDLREDEKTEEQSSLESSGSETSEE